MIATAALLGTAILLAVAAPRMAGSAWGRRVPSLALIAWQSASITIIAAAAMAGLAMLVASSPITGGVTDIFHACAITIREAYASPARLPGVAIGLVLSVGLPTRIAWFLASQLVRGGRRRRHMRRLLSGVARHDMAVGASVVETDAAAAAFCLAGKGGTIVLTRAAVRSLSVPELAAVLAHERAHLRGRHDIAVGFSQALARALPHVPMFAVAAAEVSELVELIADDSAVQQVDRTEVASALVTLAGMTAPAVALSAAQGATVARVARLLEPGRPISRLHTLLGEALGVLAVGVPLAGVTMALAGALASGLCTIPHVALG